MAEKLRIGDTLPALTLDLLDGSAVRLPDDLAGAFGVLLFYRGHW